MTPLKVAIAGLGTVGAGTLKVLRANGESIAARCGRAIQVTAVSARAKSKNRGVSLESARWFDDPVKMAEEADADVVVELIGGADGADAHRPAAARGDQIGIGLDKLRSAGPDSAEPGNRDFQRCPHGL